MNNEPKPVFTIIEAPNLEKDIFRRIGTAFVNRDESITVLLDALPLGGKLQIRQPRPGEFRPKEAPAELAA